MTPGWAFWRYELERLSKWLLILMIAGASLALPALVVVTGAGFYWNYAVTFDSAYLITALLVFGLASSMIAVFALGKQAHHSQDRFIRLRPVDRMRLLLLRTGFALGMAISGYIAAIVSYYAGYAIINYYITDKSYLVGSHWVGIGLLLSLCVWLIHWCIGVIAFPSRTQRIAFISSVVLSIFAMFWISIFFWDRSVDFPDVKYVWGMYITFPLTSASLWLLIPAALAAFPVGLWWGTRPPAKKSATIPVRVIASFVIPFVLLSCVTILAVARYYDVRPADGHLKTAWANRFGETVWLEGRRPAGYNRIQSWMPGSAPGKSMEGQTLLAGITESGWLFYNDDGLLNTWTQDYHWTWLKPDLSLTINHELRTKRVQLSGDKVLASVSRSQIKVYDTLGQSTPYARPPEMADSLRLLWGDENELWSVSQITGYPDSVWLTRFRFGDQSIRSWHFTEEEPYINKHLEGVFLTTRHTAYLMRPQPAGEAFEDIWERIWTVPDSMKIIPRLVTRDRVVAAHYAKWTITHCEVFSSDGRIQYFPRDFYPYRAQLSPDEKRLFWLYRPDELRFLLRIEEFKLDMPGDSVPHRVLWQATEPVGWERAVGFNIAVSKSRVMFVDLDGHLQVWNSRTENFEQVTRFGDLDSLPK